MRHQRRIEWLCALAVALLGIASATARAESTPKREREEYLELYGLLAEAVAQVELNYAEPIDRRELFESALNGMLRDLDPYSRYIPPAEFAAYQDKVRASRIGTGLELAVRDGQVVVLGVTANSPASEQKIVPGDRVLTVNDLEAKSLSLSQVEEQLNALADTRRADRNRKRHRTTARGDADKSAIVDAHRRWLPTDRGQTMAISAA